MEEREGAEDLRTLEEQLAEQRRTIDRLEHALETAGASSRERAADRWFDLSPDMLAVISMRNGHWSRVNRALCEALGWSEAELLAMSCLALVHPEDLERAEQAAAELAAGRPLSGFEERLRCKDGSYKWTAWNAVPDLAEGATYGTGWDVTERRRADELLSAQNRALEAVAGTAPLEEVLAALTAIVEEQSGHSAVASIMLVDDDGLRLRSCVGPSLPQAFHDALDGVAIAENVGTCASAAAINQPVVTPDIAEATSWKGFAQLPLALGLKAAWSMPIRGSRGRVVGTFDTWFRECREPNPWERQIVEGLCQSAAWAIERRRAVGAIREGAERLRSALEAADVGTWRVDLTTGLATRDASLNRIIGLRARDLTEPVEVCFTRVHPEDRPRAREAWQTALAGADYYDVEVRVVRPDGSLRWVRDRGRVVRGRAGEACYATGALADITERKEAEEALRESDRRKDEFLAVLGHELRNPLAPLRTGVALLQEVAGLPERIESVRGMMERQVAHLVRLVGDLLDVSRISQGKVALQREALDLAEAIEAAVELTRPICAERRHDLVVEAAAGPLPIVGDLERLTQVVANLLHNAAKYTEPGGRIRVSSGRVLGQVELRVRDTGLGIPPERRPQLFRMFSQLPEHRERLGAGGLGIGLALSREIIALHGGTIEARSEGLGRGTEMIVRLPLGAHARAAGGGVAQECTEPEAHGRRVLVVDDNFDAADSLRMLLASKGHDVRAVHDGPSALRAVQDFQPEVVLLDIGMPEMNGYEVARRIRGRPDGAKLLLIAVTGWGQEGDRRRTGEAGFDAHLTKPVDLQTLREMLRRGGG